ncbi:MAG: hypothetical protein SGPRY_012422 [Prymnesium sp.]
MPTAAKDIIARLLHQSSAARIGMRRGGTKEVLDHDFFAGINWTKLEARQLPMPFIPKVNDPLDTSNFDEWPPQANPGQWDRYIDPTFEEVWQSEFGM